MTLAELLAAHSQSMHALTATNLEEVKAISEKLRSVLGDPYAAYRLNRSLAEETKPDDLVDANGNGG